MMRRILTWAVIIFVAFYLIHDPAGAAHTARGALSGLHTAGTSLAAFVSGL